MKGTVLAAAALLGGASAHNNHAHDAFHLKRRNDTGLACSPVVKTVTGDFICMYPVAYSIPKEPRD